MTRAPRSASWRVANGTATACSIARTVTPLSGKEGMSLVDHLACPAARFRQPDPGRRAEEQREGEQLERRAESARLRQRYPDDERGQRAEHPADVVRQSLRRRPNRGRIELGDDRAEPREEAGP